MHPTDRAILAALSVASGTCRSLAHAVGASRATVYRRMAALVRARYVLAQWQRDPSARGSTVYRLAGRGWATVEIARLDRGGEVADDGGAGSVDIVRRP
jgi:predicted ArsR family transcriptional regulator